MEQRVDATWCKSTRSGTNGNCVEVADAGSRVIVRDTADRDGVIITVPGAAGDRFTIAIRKMA
jgi:hypothetical protein